MVLILQGVIEYSISLFFAKLVAYTFLFWLPYYLAYHRELLSVSYCLSASPYSLNLVITAINNVYVGHQNADLLSTLYDVGGIIGKECLSHDVSCVRVVFGHM